MSNAFIGGICLAFVGSTGESLGLTLQKLSHDREHEAAIRENRPVKFYLRQKMWWIGISIFVVGNIMDFIAFGLTGQTTVILVGCWALCVNLYTAPKILKEERSMIDLIAATLIMIGIGMAVGAGNQEDREWTTSELLDRYTKPAVIVLLLLVFVICVITYITTRLYDRAHPRKNIGPRVVSEIPSDVPQTPDSIVSNLIEASVLESKSALAGTSDTVLEDDRKPAASTASHADADAETDKDKDDGGAEQPMMPLYIRIQHVLLSAMVATLTVCTAKATSEMLIQSINGENQFSGWGFLIVALFLISLPTQLHFINVSLMVNDALFHIPVFYVFWQIGATVTGGVLYQEFDGFKTWQWVVYVFGVCFLLGGIKIASERLAKIERAMRSDTLPSEASPMVLATPKPRGASDANHAVDEDATADDGHGALIEKVASRSAKPQPEDYIEVTNV